MLIDNDHLINALRNVLSAYLDNQCELLPYERNDDNPILETVFNRLCENNFPGETHVIEDDELDAIKEVVENYLDCYEDIFEDSNEALEFVTLLEFMNE